MLLTESQSELLREWDYQKNEEDIKTVSVSSHITVWWKCENNHSWKASVANRYRKHQGCPYCSGKLAIVGVNDLFTTNPELEKSWDYEKNTEINPKQLKAGSEVKAWWICPQGHSWNTKILYRAVRGYGCRYCSGQAVLEGFNDLASNYPELIEEWDYDKNTINPQNITGRTNKKVWWKCSICGNSYQATIYNRTYNNSGCSKCYARNKTSFPEQAIFYYIKQYFADAVNGYTENFEHGMELDIYIPTLQIAIEYDGLKWHSLKENKARDLKKYEKCKSLGIKLIRIKEAEEENDNSDISIYTSDKYTQETFLKIFDELESLLGCHIIPNIDEDRVEIIKQYKYALRENSLAVLYPEISLEWDDEANKGLIPAMFSPGSNEKVYWICPNGHQYRTSISSRISHQISCPVCTGKKVQVGFNDLASKYPSIAEEWDFELNGELTPKDVTWGSGKKVWWRCKKGHPSYRSYIYSRTGKEKTGCPICSNNKVLVGTNDFATCCKELLKEWDCDKNIIEPSSILPGSNYKAYWICKNGHSWKETVAWRTGRGTGCPYCSSHRVVEGCTDLRTLYPEIADEWNYELNEGLRPEQFLPKSNKKVWWKCKQGHSWKVAISNRQINGCPYCSGRFAIPGETDFKTKYPEDALDWDYDMNGELMPENCKPTSHKKVYWKCHLCGHHWQQYISDKIKGNTRCPECKKRINNKR